MKVHRIQKLIALTSLLIFLAPLNSFSQINKEAIEEKIKPAAPKLNEVTSPTNQTPQLISGEKESGASVWINGKEICPRDVQTTWSFSLPLKIEGENPISLTCKNKWNKESDPTTAVIVYDKTPPVKPTINPVVSPTNQIAQRISGTKESNSSVWLNSSTQIVDLNKYSEWSYNLKLNEGINNLILTSKDAATNESSPSQASITLDTGLPQITDVFPTEGSVILEENPTLKANYSDLVGINKNKVSLIFNGLDVTKQSIITNEYISYTSPEPLQDGIYTAKVTVFDLAANQSQREWSFSVYKGVLVTQEGGEVISQDARAKIIIPPGALSEPTQIRILGIDKEKYNVPVPEGYELSFVVECSPRDLEFNSPVDLILKNKSALIPGTKIELGVYDTNQSKFVFAGQSSVVEADNYTMNFSINHFATYAPLIPTTAGGSTPVGAGVEIPLPDMFTGAFSHAVGISVPPGRRNMQPNLKLTYKSSNPNSWVGYGWDLNSGFIMRSTKNGPPTYEDSKDTFIFISDAGGTELTYLVDNLYQAKIESNFAKFYKEGDTWKIIQKDGTVIYLGTTTESKEGIENNTFAWYTTEVLDNNSNYVEFEYIKDKGKPYLSQIKYTGNDRENVLPKHTVYFNLQDRPDVTSSYISGFEITLGKRLYEILTYIDGEPKPVWTYDLVYEESPDTKRSLLKSVTQKASDGKTLPVQTFKYQRAE